MGSLVMQGIKSEVLEVNHNGIDHQVMDTIE